MLGGLILPNKPKILSSAKGRILYIAKHLMCYWLPLLIFPIFMFNIDVYIQYTLKYWTVLWTRMYVVSMQPEQQTTYNKVRG